MVSINSLAASLVGIFVPIFILSQGYDLKDVIYFFIVWNIVLLAVIIIAAMIGKKIGLQAVLILRLPFLFLYFLSLLTWETFQFSYFLIAFFGGAQSALYWMPLNIIFARESKPKDMGKLVSKLIAYPQIAGLIGPLVGAIMIKQFSFNFLFTIAFLVAIFSVTPILGVEIKKVKYDLNFKKGLKLFRKYKKYMLAEIFDNFSGEAEGIIWPVFIFLTSASVISVGLIGAFIPIGSIIFTLLIGRWVDKRDYRFFMRTGALSLLVVWLLRFMFNDPWIYYLTTVLAGFCISLVIVPYTAKMTKLAKQEVVDEFIVFREIFFFIGRIILFLIALLLISNIKLLFPLAGLAYLYFLFL